MPTKHTPGAMRSARWFFKFPGQVYAMGPTQERYVSVRKVREMLLRVYFPSNKRLPRGVEVWTAS